ncbi:hypothetical protein C8R43DRAFT_1233740 [Mycena crocata]|nr:hypothetical protein C8R43DRAFT_1233740 [Mycena crocata]
MESIRTTKMRLPSPIRRLPSELLLEIFSLCSFAFTPSFEEVSGTIDATFETEIKRLAHLPLLTLSQVCSLWHSLALGTPSLWGTIEVDNMLWRSPIRVQKVLYLLQCAIERSGNSPLDLSIVDTDDEPVGLAFQPILDLLTPTSERWRSFTLHAPLSVFQALAEIRGRLPRLENLKMEIWEDESAALDVLEDMPRLKRFVFSGPPAAISKLPLRQISSFSWEDIMMNEASAILGVLPHLQEQAAFALELDVMENDHMRILNFDLPPITAHISSLCIRFINDYYPGHCRQALREIFACLTLPMVKTLTLQTDDYPTLAIYWPHSQFLDLAARSSFGTHFVCLSLYHVLITEAELLACLSVLPALQKLQMSDHQVIAEGTGYYHLLTDDLLRALTYDPDVHTLAPALCIFDVRSLLRFDDNVYLAFLRSRTYMGREYCFESNIWWLPGCHREMDAQVVEQLDQMCMQGNLLFHLLPADDY